MKYFNKTNFLTQKYLYSAVMPLSPALCEKQFYSNGTKNNFLFMINFNKTDLKDYN